MKADWRSTFPQFIFNQNTPCTMNSDLDHFVVYCTKQRPQVANDSEIL